MQRNIDGCFVNADIAAVVPTVTYSGPGDVKASASAWWGLRAYSAAKIGTSAVRLVRASDSTQQDFITLNDGSLDVASITTFLTSTTGKVVTLYDQTGGGMDMTQATDANRPTFTLSGLGSLPVVTFGGSQRLKVTPASAINQPVSVVAAYKRTSGTLQGILASVDAGVNDTGLHGGAADTAKVGWGSGAINRTATDNTWHSLVGIGNGASDDLYVDGVSGGSANVGSSGFINTQPICFGSDPFNTDLTGAMVEGGVWPVAFSGTDVTNMDNNISAYWGI